MIQQIYFLDSTDIFSCFMQGRFGKESSTNALITLMNIYIQEKRNSEVANKIKTIFVNLLKSVRLEDRAIRDQFSYFLFFFIDNFKIGQEYNVDKIIDRQMNQIKHIRAGHECLKMFDLQYYKIINDAFEYSLNTENKEVINFSKPNNNPKINELMNYLNEAQNKISDSFISDLKNNYLYLDRSI